MTTWNEWREAVRTELEAYVPAGVAVQWENDDRAFANEHVLLRVVSSTDLSVREILEDDPVYGASLRWEIVRDIRLQIKCESVVNAQALSTLEEVRANMARPRYRAALCLVDAVPEFYFYPTITESGYSSDGRRVAVYWLETSIRARFDHDPDDTVQVIDTVGGTWDFSPDGSGEFYVERDSTVATLIQLADGAQIDALGALRVSEQVTTFDSRQNLDNQPLLWDDQEVSGTGTTSTHSTDRASSTIGVSALTPGKRVRQTFQYHNYQAGKSQRILETFVLGSTSTGITKRVGYFDDNNGLFLQSSGGTVSIVRRTHVSGSPVDNATAQDSWNLDALDGTGPSGLTLDLTKAQLFVMNFLWLGVGRIRHGFVFDGQIVYFHQESASNALSTVWASTPSLPMRYEIENDGSGGSNSLEFMCGSVVSEGGHNPQGIPRYVSTNGVHVNADVADTIYAVTGVRLSAKGPTINLHLASLISETNDDFEWLLYLNPTYASAPTWAAVDATSHVETFVGATANTITGGTKINGGFAKQTSSIETDLHSLLKPGFYIDGTPTELVLAVRPLSAAADIQGAIHFEEIP